MKKKYLAISLAINVVFIIAIGGFIIHRREKIIDKVHSLIYGAGHSPIEKVLATFNLEPLEAVNDSLMIGADACISCLFLGNSLTLHDVPDEELDKEKRGLTATKKENDYVHRLVSMIALQKNTNVKYSIVNISRFERTFKEHSFDMEELAFVKYKNPDFLFVQIGENVRVEDLADPGKFETECNKLLSLFPHSKRIVAIPFWGGAEKEYAITNVAIQSNSALVDLSHLGIGTDKRNFASSYRKYKVPGVGNHPGDYGMENIAKCFYATFNSLYESQGN